MVQLLRQTSQLLLIIYFLLPFIPDATSYKIFANNFPDLSIPSSGCPFAQLNSLLSSACNVLGDVFFNIQPPELTLGEQIRPEPGYYYSPPNTVANPPDQRGPCPALNLLANYGYLPRNGIVTLQQVLDATARGFNMGTDIATALATVAIFFTGNTTTETFSIGAPDPRVGIGNSGGLDTHNAIETDISSNREDYYTGNCDDHHLSSRLFKQNVQFAKKQGGLFNLNAMTSQYAQNANYSKANNPYLYYSPLSLIVSTAAHVFYPYFFSNGTYEDCGQPDYISISNIVGANLITNGNNYNFEYIPEQWPEVNNAAGKPWYRRAYPLTFAELLAIEPLLYAANPVSLSIGPFETSNLTAQNLGCAAYFTLLQFAEFFAAQSGQNVTNAVAWITSKLDLIFGEAPFGCLASSFGTDSGSSLPTLNGNSIPITCSLTTNQYYNVYFPTAPK